jgi:hypothetical protein
MYESKRTSCRIFGSKTLTPIISLGEQVLACIADRNPRKHGAQTLETNISIASEDDVCAKNPNYFLVLPYHFLPEMLEREKAFISRCGRFIAPVLTVHLIP